MIDHEAKLAAVALWLRVERWRIRMAAFVAGAVSILSMAPFFVWPILWLTLPALLWLLTCAEQVTFPAWRLAPWQRSGVGRAAEIGWWFGFGYHVFGLFWVGEAFLVEADIFAWLLPFAVTGLPAGLALFTAAACAFAAWATRVSPSSVIPAQAGTQASQTRADVHLGSRLRGNDAVVGMGARSAVFSTWPRVFALAIGFGVTEWLRGHIFTGFPWNILGYALTSDVLLLSASWFGIYGLTVLAILIFMLPAALWQHSHRGIAVVLPLLLLSGLALIRFGEPLDYRLTNGKFGSWVGQPTVRIVQPSILQREKWRPEHQRRIFDDHLAMSLTNPSGQPDDAKGIALIVWPEAAMPFLPLQEPVAMAEIGRMLPERITLASGALRADPPVTPGERRRVYNSLMLFGRGAPNAEVLATYDKTHLVPFGEYLPAQRMLEAIGLQQLSRMRGGFTAGPEPRPLLDVPGVGKLAPLICYEAIFPGRVVQTRERPRAFLNVTNDGWFGNTTGPRQHLHMARVRAVEEGIPVIRAANNGISAVIDPFGNIGLNASLALNVRGTLDARLPPVIAPPLYARLGDALFLLLVVALVTGLAVDRLRLRS